MASERTGTPVTLVALFAATVLVSAFLLFQVQPMIGKYILPWFGATPGVWATSLLFFQLMLLGGYAYAHFVVSRLTWRRQAIVHATLLCLALVALPITPAEAWKPTSPDAPIGRILLILTLSVGAPFFLLSATAPLLQRWFTHLHPGRSPYRLYALSNVGSFLALLSYPFLIERFVHLRTQTSMWSMGYVVFASLCAACAWRLSRSGVGVAEPRSEPADRPGAGKSVLWLLLSACGSGLLLATTNQMSMDIAVVPFLWILPLSIYLLTFILCFDSDVWYVRPLFAALLAVSLLRSVRILTMGLNLGIGDQVVGYALTLFVCCMCCHGELARLRPAPRHLTHFFLMVSTGGAVGGLTVAVLAPAVFKGLYEYHILLVACAVLVVFVQLPQLFRSGDAAAGRLMDRVLTWICWEVVLAAIVLGTYRVFDSGTWFGDSATSNLVETFAAWRAGMLGSVPFAGAFLLVVLEFWRRWEGVPFRFWWGSRRGVARLGVSGMLAVGLWSLTGALIWQLRESERLMVAQDRNFYGMLAITEFDVGTSGHRLALLHGRIRHGQQLVARPGWPTMYYGPSTGVGLALRYHPARSDETRQFRVGVVGLGVGTLAAYANARVDPDLQEALARAPAGGAPDYVRFYELNPLVVRWASEKFTFLADARSRGADVDVLEGDARIVLERQLSRGEEQDFDVLVVDAFSSDAIPLHLLTEESVQTYLRHLREDGILAIHVTNRYVALAPVVGRLAEAFDLNAIYLENDDSENPIANASTWVLLTNNQAFLDVAVVREQALPMPPPGPLWTDDFSSIFEVLRTNN